MEDLRKFKIKNETDCRTCIHKGVCSHKKEDRCANFLFGRSDETGCNRCTNHYARFGDNQPCFRCFHYRKTYEDWDDWEDRALSNICLIMSDPKTDSKQKENSLIELRGAIDGLLLNWILEEELLEELK